MGNSSFRLGLISGDSEFESSLRDLLRCRPSSGLRDDVIYRVRQSDSTLAVDRTSPPLAPGVPGGLVSGGAVSGEGRGRWPGAQPHLGKVESYSVGFPEEACSYPFIFSQ